MIELHVNGDPTMTKIGMEEERKGGDGIMENGRE